MKLMKLKLLIVALVLLVANSAFAALSYNVSIDTSSLNGTDGYLYFQYAPFVDAISSTATISGFTGGTLASANDTVNIIDGSAVTGMLPGSVVFGNTSQSATNDYNHAIHFGNSLSFLVSFNNYLPAGQTGSSTFSLGLFQDAQGSAALLGGTLFTIDLLNDGSTSSTIIANQASATPTPIPAAFWLLGSGLAGLAGIRRRS